MAKDINQMINYFYELANNTPGLIEAIVTEAALRVDKEAKKNCPVDTGNLRASITMEVKGNEAEVGTNVEYAPFVEYGTSNQGAQPFMTPARQKVEGQLNKIMVKEVKSYVRD